MNDEVNNNSNETSDNGDNNGREESKWTSDVMATIMEHGDNEVRGSVRMVTVQEKKDVTEDTNDFVCEGHYHPVKKQSRICLATIAEGYEDGPEESWKTLSGIETKISTASCHKRRRGYERRLNQQILKSNEARDLSGLIKCEVQGANRAQNDTGATHSITNNKSALYNFHNIPRMSIAGIASESTAIYATGRGYLPIQTEEGDILMAECLYSEHAAGTLLSPTAIALQYRDIYAGWTVYANIKNESGYLKFINEDGINHASIGMYYEDRMWFHYLTTGPLNDNPTIPKLSTISEFELWHH